MTISINARRVLACLLVAIVATLIWLLSDRVLHWPDYVSLGLFGFVLILLGISISF